MKEFHQRRRQQFMTEKFFQQSMKFAQSSDQELQTKISGVDNDSDDIRRLTYFLADSSYTQLSTRYTAGEPIEPLRNELENVIAAYERYTAARRIHEEDPKHPPLYFMEIDEYERALQMIGLCYLLHRRDLLLRISAILDQSYFGSDAVYEDLMSYEFNDRHDTERLFHLEPFKFLIDAMYCDTDEQSAAALKAYCDNWYIPMKKAPWHNSHLDMEDKYNYFGYWAFEAGALALLLELDDSSIDHMVYPRDLVAWSRSYKPADTPPPAVDDKRCEGGQPCPRAGIWSTLASPDSTRRFKKGEIMSSFPNSRLAASIWNWDGE